MATRYLYLRTKLALEHSPDAVPSLGALADHWPYVFGIGKFRLVWQDGMVVRFESSQTPKAISRWLSSKLSKFEAWACHDGLSRCHDYPHGAQASTFFEGLGSKPVSQIFLEYNKDDLRLEQLVDRLKGILEFKAKAKCRSVADFRNGKIILVAANEPQHITLNRCRDCLKDRLRYAFVDSGGECHSATALIEDEAGWTRITFQRGRGLKSA